MNSIIEARELTLKYLEPVVTKHGFTVKLSASKQLKIERKASKGMDLLAFDMLNYAPAFQIRYGFIKVNTTVNEILLKLQEKIKLSLPVDKKSTLVSFSYNTINNPTETSYLPMMETEEDVQQSVALLQSFLEEVGVPLLKRFDDLAEIDRVINGEQLWETDWLKPYVFGGNFTLKRLIVAKLAGLGSYDRVFAYVREWYTARFDDKYAADYKAGLAEAEALDELLK